jgi:axial budding pattern protein 2
MLRSSQQPAVPPTGTKVSPVVESPSNPFDRPGLPSHPGSTIMTNSPSTSTAEHSIPRRRADFAPPRSPAQAHLEDTRLSRQLSTGSTGSLASDTSAITHATEAVIQNASKAISIRSGKSGSGISHPSAISEPAQATVTRPRLVPFTSAARVPIPRRPSSPFLEAGSSTNKRVASQTAKVWKSRPLNSDDDVGKSPSGDELRMGVHYMQSLGEEHSGLKPSFPSLESLHRVKGSTGENVLRTLVRVGEKFVFRVPVPPASPTLSRARVFEVKLISGEPLPVFLQVDMGEIAKGVVKFSGMPSAADLGELAVGVFTSEGICVSQMILEVVQWR